MHAKITFRAQGRLIAETAAAVVPSVGDAVTLDGVRGRRRYRVTDVNHQYTDTRARTADSFIPAPVIVDIEDAP